MQLALKQEGEFDYLEMHFPLEQNSLASQQLAIKMRQKVEQGPGEQKLQRA